MARLSIEKWKLWVAIAVVAIVACFFIVSLILASVHGQDVVTEWQTWFGIAKEVEEPVVETAKVLFLR